MKNVLLKFAGLFVERVPVDESGQAKKSGKNLPMPKGAPPAPNTPPPGAMVTPQPGQAPAGMPQQQFPNQPQQPGQVPHHAASQQHAPQQTQYPPQAGTLPGAPQSALAVALRAWVPQEHAAHLAPHGLNVIAASGSLTSEQARGWGADVLIVSAECLGNELHLLEQPQLPTVFITPQQVMIPDARGVVQVQEPLRVSELAHAVREAREAWMQR